MTVWEQPGTSLVVGGSLQSGDHPYGQVPGPCKFSLLMYNVMSDKGPTSLHGTVALFLK